jgi:hypothetical protein
MNDILVESWNKYYTHYPPIGFILRSKEEYNFLRIHSLPESKRYPSNIEDSNLIIGKFTEITQHIFMRGEEVVLFLIQYEIPTQIVSTGWNMSKLRIIPSPWLEKIEEYNDIEEMVIYFGYRNWEEGCANTFCLAASENTVASITLFSSLTGNVVCPYDGGFDVFMPDKKLYKSFSLKFKNNFP